MRKMPAHPQEAGQPCGDEWCWEQWTGHLWVSDGHFKALKERWRQKIGFHPMQFLNHWFTMQCSAKVKRALTTTVLAKFCTLLGEGKAPFVAPIFPVEQAGRQHPDKSERTKDLVSWIIWPGMNPSRVRCFLRAKAKSQESQYPYLNNADSSSAFSTSPIWLFCILQTGLEMQFMSPREGHCARRTSWLQVSSFWWKSS